MDSIEITTELNKINMVHGSLDETNPITYIIFQETFRDRLTEAQHAWLDVKIYELNHKATTRFEMAKSNMDVGLAMADIREKFEDTGVMRKIE
jgi:predicted YcjX-like family ATPase